MGVRNMSVFYGCENCGVRFDKPQYDFCLCEKCLLKIQCYKCEKFLTMDDHRKSTSELCFSCDKEYEFSLFVKDQERIAREKIIDMANDKYSKLTNEDLEKSWQSSANEIALNCQLSWKKDQTKELSDKYHKLAELAQNKQEEIQKEITKRG